MSVRGPLSPVSIPLPNSPDGKDGIPRGPTSPSLPGQQPAVDSQAPKRPATPRQGASPGPGMDTPTARGSTPARNPGAHTRPPPPPPVFSRAGDDAAGRALLQKVDGTTQAFPRAVADAFMSEGQQGNALCAGHTLLALPGAEKLELWLTSGPQEARIRPSASKPQHFVLELPACNGTAARHIHVSQEHISDLVNTHGDVDSALHALVLHKHRECHATGMPPSRRPDTRAADARGAMTFASSDAYRRVANSGEDMRGVMARAPTNTCAAVPRDDGTLVVFANKGAGVVDAWIAPWPYGQTIEETLSAELPTATPWSDARLAMLDPQPGDPQTAWLVPGADEHVRQVAWEIGEAQASPIMKADGNAVPGHYRIKYCKGPLATSVVTANLQLEPGEHLSEGVQRLLKEKDWGSAQAVRPRHRVPVFRGEKKGWRNRRKTHTMAEAYASGMEVGKGSFGAVNAVATQPGGTLRYAIKKAKPFQNAYTGAAQAAVQRELDQESGALRGHGWHPGVVTTTAVDVNLPDRITQENIRHVEVYTAAPLCSGGAVATLTGRGEPEVDRAVVAIADYANAMCHLHQRNLAHRDTKPGNMMFRWRDGPVAVIDPGMATEVDPSRSVRPGGTPDFMSPRLCAHFLAGTDVPTDELLPEDVWQTGAALFQLLVTDASGAHLSPHGALARDPSIPNERPELRPIMQLLNRAKHFPKSKEKLVIWLERQLPEHPLKGQLVPILAGMMAEDPTDRITMEEAHERLAVVAAQAAVPRKTRAPY